MNINQFEVKNVLFSHTPYRLKDSRKVILGYLDEKVECVSIKDLSCKATVFSQGNGSFVNLYAIVSNEIYEKMELLEETIQTLPREDYTWFEENEEPLYCSFVNNRTLKFRVPTTGFGTPKVTNEKGDNVENYFETLMGRNLKLDFECKSIWIREYGGVTRYGMEMRVKKIEIGSPFSKEESETIHGIDLNENTTETVENMDFSMLSLE